MSDKTDTRFEPRRLRRWREGNAVSARHLNEAVEAVDRLQKAPTGVREIVNRRTRAPQMQQFRLVSVAGDFLRCRELNGPYNAEAEVGVYLIAKPHQLRQTPFDGETRDGITYDYTNDSGTARTGTDADGYDEDQEVVPAYVADDVIYAARNVGGMSVVVDRGDGVEVGLDWLDLNVDARAWGAA